MRIRFLQIPSPGGQILTDEIDLLTPGNEECDSSRMIAIGLERKGPRDDGNGVYRSSDVAPSLIFTYALPSNESATTSFIDIFKAACRILRSGDDRSPKDPPDHLAALDRVAEDRRRLSIPPTVHRRTAGLMQPLKMIFASLLRTGRKRSRSPQPGGFDEAAVLTMIKSAAADPPFGRTHPVRVSISFGIHLILRASQIFQIYGLHHVSELYPREKALSSHGETRFSQFLPNYPSWYSINKTACRKTLISDGSSRIRGIA